MSIFLFPFFPCFIFIVQLLLLIVLGSPGLFLMLDTLGTCLIFGERFDFSYDDITNCALFIDV